MYLNNALIAVVKSVLHTSGLYTRELSDSVARQVVVFMCNNSEELIDTYGITDEFELAESFTRDFVAEVK